MRTDFNLAGYVGTSAPGCPAISATPDATTTAGATSESISEPPVAPAGPERPALAFNFDLARPQVRGKFFFIGEKKLYLRGVTYGPFRPEADGCEYHRPEIVERDFARMVANGINTVRTYTVPPRWLLDVAHKYGLRLLVGLPWEQHINFLDSARRCRDLERTIRAAARTCAGHSALLAFAIGNEIPSRIVRWYGEKRVERFLHRLYLAVKLEDSEALVTYVNYPSTEYLELPFLDFVAFNVYLESQNQLQAYVNRLQNISAERPLVMAEIGLDSRRHGLRVQARSLEWQVRTLLANGCAGVFVFAWTDEWHRGGHDIEDWDFGLTTRDRQPKPALETIRQVFREIPCPTDASWPFISVVICSYNGSRTIRQALEALRRVQYSKFEVLVIDDGSRDTTPAIAAEFGVRLIRQPNAGLSAARNVGWQQAKGQIVAYLDDDAAPDSHWLHFLAGAFLADSYAGVGGPNIAFPDDNFIAQCVDLAPGNPTHVLLTDREAEHLPGCNMAFRRDCLAAVGGFDSQFHIAGDDVDLCWRLQKRGWKLGFHPGAMVWHHRRNSIRTYWRQQFNYGRAEAMLERKWPEKYNPAGQPTWNGRLYGRGFRQMFQYGQYRIYHGSWGTALFQSLYSIVPGTWRSLLIMPEWYLFTTLLALLSVIGIFFAPLRWAAIPLVMALLPPISHAWVCGARAFLRQQPQRLRPHWCQTAMIASLHFIQPMARLSGRLCQGLTPWRWGGADRMVLPWVRTVAVWSETHWRSPEERLSALERAMRESGAVVVSGGDFDHWDLEVRGGMFGTARLTLMTEEHGSGRQLVRFRIRPVGLACALLAATFFALLAATAGLSSHWTAWAVLNIPALLLLGRVFFESGTALAVALNALTASLGDGEKRLP